MSSKVEVWVVEVVNATGQSILRGLFDTEAQARRVESDQQEQGFLVHCWNMMAKPTKG